MPKPIFDRRTKRAAALGALAGLAVAGAGALGAGQWLERALGQLFAEPEAPAGLDLTTRGLDLGEEFGSRTERPGRALRPVARSKPGHRRLLLRKDQTWGTGTPATPSRLVPYAGFGIGVFRLSMDLAERNLGLTKEKKQRQTRVFAGLGYVVTPNLTMNLEYRALPAGEPLFTLDLGHLAFDVDNPFQDHNINLQVNYRF